MATLTQANQSYVRSLTVRLVITQNFRV